MKILLLFNTFKVIFFTFALLANVTCKSDTLWFSKYDWADTTQMSIILIIIETFYDAKG